MRQVRFQKLQEAQFVSARYHFDGWKKISEGPACQPPWLVETTPPYTCLHEEAIRAERVKDYA